MQDLYILPLLDVVEDIEALLQIVVFFTCSVNNYLYNSCKKELT